MTADPSAVKLKEWQINPKKFVWDCFGVEPDKWQEQALEVFPSQEPDKLRVSLQACAGPGKTAVLAWCGLNFLTCYGNRNEHPKGAAVSVTHDNLKDNLWPEFSVWRNRSPFCMKALEWTKERIFAVDHPETWFLSARSWSKTSNAEEQGRTLSGLHSKYVLVLVDEGGEIPLSVLKAGEQALSTGPAFGKILMAGNPTSLDGILYAAATTLRHLWHIIRITGDPDDPNRSPRINIDWAREQIKTYGRDNPWVMAYILGLFPPASLNSLIGPDDVMAAMKRHYTEDKFMHAQKRLGVDVARFGDDRTIIFPRQGLAAFRPAEMRGARTPDISARVMKAHFKWAEKGTRDIIQLVDGTGGWGAGVIDSLIQAGQAPTDVQSSGKPIDNRYYNKRAEMWFEMAEWIKRGGALPPIDGLVKELTTPTYTFKNGKFLLESKEQIKARLGCSPDLADALALTFALPELPASSELDVLAKIVSEEHHSRSSEWDPFDSSRY